MTQTYCTLKKNKNNILDVLQSVFLGEEMIRGIHSDIQ